MLLQFHLQYFLSGQKMYELQRSAQVLLYKKLLTEQNVYENKKLSIVYYYPLIIQTNSSYSDIY